MLCQSIQKMITYFIGQVKALSCWWIIKVNTYHHLGTMNVVNIFDGSPCSLDKYSTQSVMICLCFLHRAVLRRQKDNFHLLTNTKISGQNRTVENSIMLQEWFEKDVLIFLLFVFPIYCICCEYRLPSFVKQ